MTTHRSVQPTISSREYGLAAGLIVGRYLFDMEDLHYGYWEPDLPVELRNMPRAQARYSEVLFADIPEGVRTILDVGCGVGTTALKLQERGYEVECIGPPGPLTELAREKLAGRIPLHECFFQDYETDKRYDLLLFSESLLFIRPLEEALAKAASLLVPGGHMLVSDLFRRTPEGQKPGPSTEMRSYHTDPIGGGHYLWDFEHEMSKSPFTLVRDTDMTERIAPTFDMLTEGAAALKPAYDLLLGRFAIRHPWITKIARKIAKLDKYEKKHFGGNRTGAVFLKYKLYRRFLYRLP